MQVTLIGIQKVSFTADDGKEINGLKIHFSADASERQAENFIGQKTDTQWIAADSQVQIFKAYANKIFENFRNAAQVLPALPVKAELLYGLDGKKVVFDGIAEVKEG